MKMVDIGDKKKVSRIAIAEGKIKLRRETIEAIKNGRIKKGDALATAASAALLAVKNTASVIPHCHPLPITHASIDFSFDDEHVKCICTVKTDYMTGVEMEALHGVAIALLTIWDMVKYMEKDENGQYKTAKIEEIRIVEKLKGLNGR